MSLTKTEIVGRVADQLGCVKSEAEDYVESVIAIMKETLESGEPLKIAGFGSFVVNQKADRRENKASETKIERHFSQEP